MLQVVGQKRRRAKFKCLVCSRVFDADYKVDHNNKYGPLNFSMWPIVGRRKLSKLLVLKHEQS